MQIVYNHNCVNQTHVKQGNSVVQFLSYFNNFTKTECHIHNNLNRRHNHNEKNMYCTWLDGYYDDSSTQIE
jgi:hypothetical protein